MEIQQWSASFWHLIFIYHQFCKSNSIDFSDIVTCESYQRHNLYFRLVIIRIISKPSHEGTIINNYQRHFLGPSFRIWYSKIFDIFWQNYNKLVSLSYLYVLKWYNSTKFVLLVMICNLIRIACRYSGKM